jgi:hypothetical protein
MKSLALDLDSGRLSRWLGDPRDFPGWQDRYGDLYTLRVQVYKSGGGKVPSCSLQLLIKKPRRRDARALWDLGTFSRVPNFITPSSLVYVGQVDATGQAYRDALKLDAAPGNDLPKADFVATLRAVTSDTILEAEFNYELINSGYRLADAAATSAYIGLSDTGGLLIRNADTNEWRELSVVGEGNETSFSLGETVLGPSDTLSISDDFVRIQNGILQIKNDSDSSWVNVILRGTGGGTLALGETPPVGFTLSNDRYKVADDGRLLIRNLTTGNWHEARVLLSGGTNILALGTEYDDTQV